MKNSTSVSTLVLVTGVLSIITAYVHGTNVGSVFGASTFVFFTGVMYICSAIEGLKK